MSSETDKSAPPPPDARLLIASGCVHCPVVLEGLSRLLKEGRIGRLEAVNISLHPEAAEEAGVRSVPWFTIGPYALSGLHSYQELAEWAGRAGSGGGLASYYQHLLESNRLDEVTAEIAGNPQSLGDLLQLLDDPDTPMAVRIGIGAIIEDLAGGDLLAEFVDRLGILTHSDQPQTRADACHYLGLSASADAAPYLKACLDDEDQAVREIAAESLALLHPVSGDE